MNCTFKITKAVTETLFDFPPTLTHLRFSKKFNSLLPPSSLPPSLTHLIFGEAYNQVSAEFPPHLVYLSFECPYFNRPINNLPNTLLHLYFSNFYPYPVSNLPPNLVTLENYTCNSPPLTEVNLSSLTQLKTYETLPLAEKNPHLTHLFFSTSQDTPISSLPSSLTHFTFSPSVIPFTSTIDIPPNLTYLSAVLQFNGPLSNLPPTLTHLILGAVFNNPLPELPPKLTHLIFGNCSLVPSCNYSSFNSEYPGPRGRNIMFNQPLDNLPSSLTHLIFGFVYDLNNVYAFHTIAPGRHKYTYTIAVPPFLTFFYLSYMPGVHIKENPNALLYYASERLDSKICQTITHLQLHDGPHFDFSYFSCLTHLDICLKRENVDISPLFPPSLRLLSIRSSFCSHKLDLSHLSLTHFVYVERNIQGKLLPKITLPLTLTHLFLSINFQAKLLFPPSLTHLAIGERMYKHPFASSVSPPPSPLLPSLLSFVCVENSEFQKDFIMPKFTRVWEVDEEDIWEFLPLFLGSVLLPQDQRRIASVF